jgi:post-segregation antitoxin (ccd killing protein)
MPKAVISASVNLDIASKIAEQARKRGIKLSQVVNEALEFYVGNVQHSNRQPRSGRTVTVCERDDQ